MSKEVMIKKAIALAKKQIEVDYESVFFDPEFKCVSVGGYKGKEFITLEFFGEDLV